MQNIDLINFITKDLAKLSRDVAMLGLQLDDKGHGYVKQRCQCGYVRTKDVAMLAKDVAMLDLIVRSYNATS